MSQGAIAIVTDSTSDLGPLAAKNGITVVPLTVRFGSEEFRDGVDLTEDEFYGKLAASTTTPVTAQPPPSLFAQTYRSIFEGGASHIISLHLSSTLSGTVNAAAIAAREVDQARITIIDTRTVTAGLGLFALEAAKRARAGDTPETIAAAIAREIPKMQFLAAIPSLKYLARGGRIGHLRGLLGNVLKIVPILTIVDGTVTEFAKVRTFARAVDQIVDIVNARIAGAAGVRLAIIHAVAPALAQSVAQRIRNDDPSSSMIICKVGPTVGTHAGPGAVGVIFVV